jgi:hypothetical protein
MQNLHQSCLDFTSPRLSGSKMRVLVACEHSGRVRDAFRSRGHDAYSCDLKPDSSGNPKYHICCDVLAVISDGGWDMMVAHPPCTHLCCSGARWFSKKQAEQQQAIGFFIALMAAPIERICMENPVGVISTKVERPTQIIQPWMFGDSFQKTTCLWLKNLPKLQPTNIVDKGEMQVLKSGKRLPKWYSNCGGDRATARSITFPGIANAMAEQWG